MKPVSVSLLLPSDFPGEASGRCASERASPLLWKNRPRRRRASHPTESSSEQGASEADIDSDSGYCSPKHNQAAGATQRTAESTTASTVRQPIPGLNPENQPIPGLNPENQPLCNCLSTQLHFYDPLSLSASPLKGVESGVMTGKLCLMVDVDKMETRWR